MEVEAYMKMAKLKAAMPEHKRLVLRTIDFISTSLSRVNSPYVSCSFGKDSAAMLHLVRRVMPGVDVIFIEYPETRFLDNYDEVIDSWGNINLHRHYVNAGILEKVNEKDIMPLIAKGYGFDSAFVGIRMEESNGRRITIKKHGKFMVNRNGIHRICPLADWSALDVSAYCVLHELPILDSYLRHGFDCRTSVGLSDDIYGFREAQLARIRQTDLSRFNIVVSIYPELLRYN